MTTLQSKTTILQILPSLKSGGVERGTIEMVKAIKQSNYNAIVVSNGGPMVDQVIIHKGQHISLPVHSKNPFIIWKNIQQLKKIIKQNNVNIVHARSRAPAWSAYYACKNTNCKFVTTIHGKYSFKKGLMGQLKKWYNSSMFKGDFIIAVSEFIKENALENYEIFKEKLKNKKTSVIHRGVDIHGFDPSKISKHRLVNIKKQMQLPDDKIIIFLPGRLSEWKGQLYLLEALRYVKSNNYFCVLLGDDKGHEIYRKRIENKIMDLKLNSFVKIHKHVYDMPAADMLADIIISASILGEPFGRVAIEGQAMKKRVIATNVGGSKETVIHEKTGWLVPHNDSQEFAKTIEKVLNLSPNKSKTIGTAARKNIVENFTTEKMCNDTIKIYKKLLKKNK